MLESARRMLATSTVNPAAWQSTPTLEERDLRHIVKTAAVLAAVCFGALSTTAQAAVVTASWTHPTSRTDGSALPLSAITATRVEHGTCNGSAFGVRNGEIIVPAPATSAQFNLPSGTHCIRAFTQAGSLESAPSAVVVHVVPVAPPNPPVLTVAQVAGMNDVAVYKFAATTNSRSTAVAGFAPVGVACVGDQVFTYRGQSYRRVSRNDVKWWGVTPSDNVAAPCA